MILSQSRSSEKFSSKNKNKVCSSTWMVEFGWTCRQIKNKNTSDTSFLDEETEIKQLSHLLTQF